MCRMYSRSLAAAGLALAVAGCTGGPAAPPTSVSRTLLARYRSEDPEAARLLGGGVTEFRRRLAAARGRGFVVNQWASWCIPCRREFPLFQRLAERYRGRVNFLGVDARDSAGDARKFLAEFPTPYPHLEDPQATIAREFRGGRAWPTTGFYSSDGRLRNSHQGAYPDERQLDADIRRYALHG